MILKRYINLEILKTSLGILTVLVLIFISSRFINYIQLAVDGTISSIAVFKLVGLEIPSVAGFLLPLSFFIATLLTMGRLYAENEMAVIKAVGVGDYQLIKYVLFSGVIVAFIAGLLSIWISPWANQTSQAVRAEEQAAAKMGIFLPGRFKENDKKSGVLFVESKADNGGIHDLFAVSGLDEKSESWKIEVAGSGKMSTVKNAQVNDLSSNPLSKLDGEQSYIILQNGSNYILNLKTNLWQITEYEEYYMHVERQDKNNMTFTTKAISTLELFKTQNVSAIAELHWRLSAPISIFILCFMAVPLSRAKPRKDKFSKLFISIMSYMVYAMLLLNGRQMLEQGKIPELLGFWWIHILAIIFCIFVYKLPFIKTLVTMRRRYA